MGAGKVNIAWKGGGRYNHLMEMRSVEVSDKAIESFLREQELGADANLIGVLQETQHHFGYLPGEALEQIGKRMRIPLSRVYGVVSFSVSRRIREVGIRISLGASHREVVRMVVGNAMGVVLVGGVAGLGLAYLLGRVIQRFLFGIQPGDPVTMTLVPILLGVVALTAAIIPARRASRVNPVEALRIE